MTRYLRLLRFAVSEGIRALGRAKLSTSTAVTVLSAALLLFGGFLSLTLLLEDQLESLSDEADLKVVISSGASDTDIQGLQGKLKQLSGVSNVTFVSKAEAAAILQEQMDLDVQELVGVNPLPATFDVTVDDAHWTVATMDSLIDMVSALSQVEEVVYDKALWARIAGFRSVASLLILAIGVVLLLVGAFVVGNTIRLTIYARRDILRIMRLLGATRGFVRRPFLVEGFIQGTLASIISIGCLHVFWEFLAIMTGYTLAPPLIVYALLLIGGWSLGLIGALWTLHRFLP